MDMIVIIETAFLNHIDKKEQGWFIPTKTNAFIKLYISLEEIPRGITW
jgi:hypothetical protein